MIVSIFSFSTSPGFICLFNLTLYHALLNMDASKLEKSLTTKSVKMVKYTHHCEFLTQCVHNKIVPKGLTAKMQLNIPGKPSERFQRRAQGILQKASLDTMALLLSRYQGLLEDLKKSIAETRGRIEQANDTEVTLKILSRVERKVSNEETT